MNFFRLSGGRRALRALVAGVLAAMACSTPAYHFVPEEQNHCSNQVTDTELGESDVDCGGADCHGCAYGAHCATSSDCAQGQCIMSVCQEPGCANQALDGDETGVDCGGTTCPACRDGQPCLVGTDCESKVCGPDGLCAPVSCTDGVRNGDELDVDCGGSVCDGCPIGSPCGVAGDCQSGLCADNGTCALNCSRGTAECDGDLSVPCETNLLTSSQSCGMCGKACELPHANSSCVGGACQIDTCTDPWIRCNTDDSDGCEVNASTDVMNCGGCGMVCPALHGTPSCVDSTCAIVCDEGFGDCDHDPLTGCEASITDVDNCGECGKKCPSSAGEPFCVDGKCGVSTCDAGKGDCDGDQICETDLDTDPDNCGRCGHVCSVANGTTDCVDGTCVVSTCDDGWDNCDASDDDGGYSTGCETNVASDTKNCGGCGQRCDMVANATGTCQGGSCALVCSAGFEDCDGHVANGCETDTTSDPKHCGGCNNPCSVPNANAACQDSACVIDSCLPNFDDCTAAAGCETDISSNVQHCGDCTSTCSKAGATAAACSGGQCGAPSCDAAHGNCDGKNANGCEADVTKPTQCGACNVACGTATPNCVLSGNAYGCQAQITIANSQPYPNAETAGATLTFQATPHAGQNRLILLAIAAESQGNGLAGARPDTVTWGGKAMTAGPSQVGTNDTWSPDEFIYYLALGDSATDEAAVQVTIDGSVAPAETAILMQELQLNGVSQTTPITASAGGYLGTATAEAPDPSVISLNLAVSVSGSLIYSLMSAESMDGGTCTPNTPSAACPSWSVSPSTNLTATETLALAPVNISGTPMRAFGMVVSGASAGLPATGTYAPSWSIPASGRMTHLAVAVAPAHSP
ncbi:MAG TPA: hypothetical protein VMI54_10590 [Polyangiaceae bacterium]|nr:hypothetical protein [Polyangiaceae bacterium]